jgi:peptidylprolyl isomerase
VRGDTLTVHYVGTFENGAVFDSSYARGEPITFRLGTGAVIQGWDQGLVGMRVGGKRRLIIPPELAYGSQGFGTIPPNTPLRFEVELLVNAGP